MSLNTNFAPGGINSVVSNVTPQQLELAAEAFAVASIAALMAAAFMQKAQGGQGSTGVPPISPQPFPPIAPPPPPPAPQMNVDKDGTIHFDDGSYLTQDSQYNWTMHNADGTTTSVTGDPHINDGKNKWDEQLPDAAFQMKNGALVFVHTVPYGNGGARVTSSLNVVYGNSSAAVTGIDKGKGVTGSVTPVNGQEAVNSFLAGVPQNGRFVEDSQDTWTLNGREITGGSTLNGLQLGKNMGTLTNGVGNGQQWAQIIFAALETALLASFAQQIAQGFTQNQGGGNPYRNYASPSQSYARAGSPQGVQNIGQAFADLGRLLQAVRAYSQLTQAQGKPVFA